MKYRIGQRVRVNVPQLISGYQATSIGKIQYINDNSITVLLNIDRINGNEPYPNYNLEIHKHQYKHVKPLNNKTQQLKHKLLKEQTR